jgi:hypothetical protein
MPLGGIRIAAPAETANCTPGTIANRGTTAQRR